MIHMGAELVVQNLMLYSTSPLGRRLSEQLLTGDPFDVDVKLDMKSSNRSAEILNTYLKTIGLRLVFIKKPKKPIIPFLIHPIEFHSQAKYVPVQPIAFYNKNEKVMHHYAYEQALREANHEPFSPLLFNPINFWDPFAGTKKKFVDEEAEDLRFKEYLKRLEIMKNRALEIDEE